MVTCLPVISTTRCTLPALSGSAGGELCEAEGEDHPT